MAAVKESLSSAEFQVCPELHRSKTSFDECLQDGSIASGLVHISNLVVKRAFGWFAD
jgi:hypothetical protein